MLNANDFDYLNARNTRFGLGSAQVRPGCASGRFPCVKVMHNAGWYNAAGEFLGWGDLCECDLKRIARECEEPFFAVREEAWRACNLPLDFYLAPGIAWVLEQAVYLIERGRVQIFTIQPELMEVSGPLPSVCRVPFDAR